MGGGNGRESREKERRRNGIEIMRDTQRGTIWMEEKERKRKQEKGKRRSEGSGKRRKPNTINQRKGECDPLDMVDD